MDQPFSFRRIISTKIPDLGFKPGSLHTIIRGESGEFYFTDEVNHSLVCTDSDGKLLWHKTGQGKEPGRFWYPKGIELGWILVNSEIIKCVAVCDSWNDRIQFFGLDSSFLSQWSAAGDAHFKRVADIRFIKSGDSAGNGFWLILDRENHRLCALAPDGQSLWQTGRMVPEKIENAWLKSLLDNAGNSLRQQNSIQLPIIDPLFYPARILGDCNDALFVQEPGRRRLKKVSNGNLLPVLLDAPNGGEWIAGDSHGLSNWSRQEKTLSYFDFSSASWQHASIEGTPISSGRPSDCIWLQNEFDLECWAWDRGVQTKSVSEKDCAYRMLSLAAREIEAAFEFYNRQEIKALFEAADAFAPLALNAIAVCINDSKTHESPKEMRDLIAAQLETLSQISLRLHDHDYALSTAILKARQALQRYPAAAEHEPFKQALNNFKSFLAAAGRRFSDIHRCRDDISMIVLSRQALPEGGHYLKEEREALITATDLAAMKALQEIATVNLEIEEISNYLSGQDSPPEPQASERTPDAWIPHPIHLSAKAPEIYLRELDRISLRASATSESRGPLTMAHAAGDQILVALHNTNTVVRLDAQGKHLGTLIPSDMTGERINALFGLALDAEYRVWISGVLSHNIGIFCPSDNIVRTFDQVTVDGIPIHYPHGLCRGWGGSILIADTGNNRIVAIDESGNRSCFAGGAGVNPGEFRHPMYLFRSPCRDSVWVAELRNHRVQELDPSGVPLRSFGSLGLGKDHFSHIESIVQFSDGMVAVGQYTYAKPTERFKELKVFSPDGKEIANQFMPFNMRGTLMHQGKLLIADFEQDCIRIYERV
jgi:hypothetical protein